MTARPQIPFVLFKEDRNRLILLQEDLKKRMGVEMTLGGILRLVIRLCPLDKGLNLTALEILEDEPRAKPPAHPPNQRHHCLRGRCRACPRRSTPSRPTSYGTTARAPPCSPSSRTADLPPWISWRRSRRCCLESVPRCPPRSTWSWCSTSPSLSAQPSTAWIREAIIAAGLNLQGSQYRIHCPFLPNPGSK